MREYLVTYTKLRQNGLMMTTSYIDEAPDPETAAVDIQFNVADDEELVSYSVTMLPGDDYE